ncbi:MAG: CDP-alcohol phosphatidyltransferase family protein [Alistipes sp.]|nr:CDP-alcohol phosphatidyltransferase family protein [Alistipes senegalensis]MCM1250936.1 CDP-alcohol phosphatidyltransferase family protein [Alistipes sp.]
MQTKLFTIPNLLTLSNLLCGASAAVAALYCDNLTAAFWLVVAAALFDFLDGFAARLLGIGGPLGVELDSLADDITFGFAPAAVLFVLYGRTEGWWLSGAEWCGAAVFLYAAFAALRLAKFNVDDTQRTEFCGLPSPAAALVCVSLGLLAEQGDVVIAREAILAAALVLGALMVSPLRMFALKFHGFGWRGNEIRYSFLFASIALIAGLRLWALPAVVALYVLMSLGRKLLCRGTQEEKRRSGDRMRPDGL